MNRWSGSCVAMREGRNLEMKFLRILFFLGISLPFEVFSLHDSLNFILPPLGRECFYEDIDIGLGARSVEIFVPSGSNLNIQLEVMMKKILNLTWVHSSMLLN
jgi:hypothetical protein